jgi:hypothetical protein
LRRRAGGAEQGDHSFVLHQLARLLDRLGRREGVVERDQIDLAPVDAALFLIQHAEIGDLRASLDTVDRQRTAIWHGLAELDLGVGGALTVFLFAREHAG